MFGIVGAMEEEITQLRAELQNASAKTVLGVEILRGELEGRPVLLVQGGIGKVNAAKTAAVLLLEGASQVIFTGVAGALNPSYAVGDIIVGTDCVQHDVDVAALGYEAGLIPGEQLAWECGATLRQLAVEAAREVGGFAVHEGRIASGDQFIASQEQTARIREQFSANAAEMEGAAVAQVCASAGVPFVIVRAISDTADGSANVDYREFFPKVAQTAKAVVRGILRRAA